MGAIARSNRDTSSLLHWPTQRIDASGDTLKHTLSVWEFKLSVEFWGLGFVSLGQMEAEPGSRYEELRTRLSALQIERLEILSELHAIENAGSQRQMDAVVDEVPVNSRDKILLFKRRFAARTDIFPRFWENASKGTKGYYPVCETVYEAGIRLKPSELYSRFGSSKFSRLDDRVIEDHLRGKHSIGSYSIRKDNRCIFLAADFDGDGWESCAVAYAESAEMFGFQVLLEISRSGDGAHAWLFFAEPILAQLARSLGTVILGEASRRLSKIDLGAYDRFFPNQDTMPKGGFGNLIGLPCSGIEGRRGVLFSSIQTYLFSKINGRLSLRLRAIGSIR